jgi:hypothetical protein
MGDLLEVGTEVYVDAAGLELEGRVLGYGRERLEGCRVDNVYLVKLQRAVWADGPRFPLSTIVAHPDNVRARERVPATELVEAPGCSGWCAECARDEMAG